MSVHARRYDWAVQVMAEKKRQGKDVPGPITRTVESKVDLYPWLQFDLDSFWHLCRMRPVHFGGVGYIPDGAINEYLELIDVDMRRYEREDFIRNVRILDDEYMKIQDEKRKEQEQQDKEKAEKDKAKGRRR